MTDHDPRGLCEACLEREYEAFRHRCVHELMDRNNKWRGEYKIDSWPRWNFDLDKSELIFSENAKTKIIANVAIAGAVSNGTWEWTWGNPHMPSDHRSLLETVRSFGEKKEWSKLNTLFLMNYEHLGWELTAVAVHILGAQGAYRCPDSDSPGNFQYLVVLNTRFIQ